MNVRASLAILRTLVRLSWREVRSFESLGGNNFVLVLFLLQGSGLFLGLLLAAMVVVPLSANPMAKIPEERLALWPLEDGARRLIAVAATAVSPIPWIGVLVGMSAGWRVGAAVVAVLVGVAAGWSMRGPGAVDVRWRMPVFGGAMGTIAASQVRQMLSTLDVYLAAGLSAVAVVYRLAAAEPDDSAMTVMALVVVLCLSTSAQCLFGLDGDSGLTRYALLPVRGRAIVMSKGMAWLAVAIVLTAALDAVAGLAAALVALAVGQHRAVTQPWKQQRWRFTGGSLLPFGLLQSILSVSAGFYASNGRVWAIGICAAVWLASTLIYGWALEQYRED